MRLQKNRSFLSYLASANTSQRKRLIQNANPDEILALCEGSLNIFNGNVRLTSKQEKTLSTHKCALRKLVNKSLSPVIKKRFLLQKGNGLLSPLLSILSPILSSIF